MNKKNILIIGAGIAGKLLGKDIKENHHNIKVIGFVDDARKTQGLTKIGKIDELAKVVEIFKVDEIVVAIPSASGELIRRILLANIKNRIPIKIVLRDLKIISLNKVKYSEFKNIKPKNFLGRPFIHKDIDGLNRYYKNKTVLVTGGAGSIGSEIVMQLANLNTKQVIVYDNSEYLIFNIDQLLRESGIRNKCQLIIGSILNKNKLDLVIKNYRPDLIIHAAAYKHVYLMEDNADEAIMNNVIGTKNIVDIAVENKIKKFTMISTDKVVNPTSIMGATKKLCEYYIKNINRKGTKFNIVRFGNVINSNGSVLPLFERQIKLYKYVTVTHKKIKRFFMSIREAAQLVVESTVKKGSDSIYILNMGELINIYDVALCIIRSQNFIPEEDVKIKIIGLKKGEKLIEELYTENELKNLQPTDIENVFKLKNFEKNNFNINRVIVDLVGMVASNTSDSNIKKYLVNIFPSLKK